MGEGVAWAGLFFCLLFPSKYVVSFMKRRETVVVFTTFVSNAIVIGVKFSFKCVNLSNFLPPKQVDKIKTMKTPRCVACHVNNCFDRAYVLHVGEKQVNCSARKTLKSRLIVFISKFVWMEVWPLPLYASNMQHPSELFYLHAKVWSICPGKWTYVILCEHKYLFLSRKGFWEKSFDLCLT